MKSKKHEQELQNRFTQGYTCAVANLIKMTRDTTGTLEMELLACNTSTLQQLIDAKCDPHDIEIVTETIQAIENKHKICTEL